jgi:acetyltransferase
VIRAAQTDRRTILTEVESKQVLAAYGIPVVRSEFAPTRQDAARLARQIGYPVVLKLHSHVVTHKTEVGGVRLNLADDAAVEHAFDAIRSSALAKAGEGAFLGVTVQPMLRSNGYELILGSSIDPQFGPVLLFGLGGQLVEVFKDRALALPPLNATLAQRLIEQTKIYRALCGVRGNAPIDIASLKSLLVRFSQLVVEQKWIKEIDINPLRASADGLLALDARVVLHDPKTPEDHLPQPAIRPYPNRYVTPWSLADGTPVTFRPIRPEDEPLMVRFHQSLSEESVRYRYFDAFKLDARIDHERLLRVCMSDYDRQIVLVIERRDPKTQLTEIIGVGRLSKAPAMPSAECALVISDAWQRRGLGTRLLQLLLRAAVAEKLTFVTAEILPANIPTQRMFERCGFQLRRTVDGESVIAEIALDAIAKAST